MGAKKSHFSELALGGHRVVLHAFMVFHAVESFSIHRHEPAIPCRPSCSRNLTPFAVRCQTGWNLPDGYPNRTVCSFSCYDHQGRKLEKDILRFLIIVNNFQIMSRTTSVWKRVSTLLYERESGLYFSIRNRESELNYVDTEKFLVYYLYKMYPGEEIIM